MAKAYMTSLPNTTDTGRGFIKTVDTPRVPAMDYRSGFKDVGVAIDNTNKFLGEYSQMKYEGFQADLDRLELEHLHEMQDATDPCDLEDINKKWQKNYDTALKDDIWSRSYYKSSFYKKWQDRNQKAQQQIYYAKQHEFAEICATDTLNKMAETASLLDNPADVQQYIENANAMLANTKHLTAEAKYKLMTNFYKDTVSRLYDSDPNKAVAFLDGVGNKYDGYGVSSEEIKTKAANYNKAKERERQADIARAQRMAENTNKAIATQLKARILQNPDQAEAIIDSASGNDSVFVNVSDWYRKGIGKDTNKARSPLSQTVTSELVSGKSPQEVYEAHPELINDPNASSALKNAIDIEKKLNPSETEDIAKQVKAEIATLDTEEEFYAFIANPEKLTRANVYASEALKNVGKQYGYGEKPEYDSLSLEIANASNLETVENLRESVATSNLGNDDKTKLTKALNTRETAIITKMNSEENKAYRKEVREEKQREKERKQVSDEAEDSLYPYEKQGADVYSTEAEKVWKTLTPEAKRRVMATSKQLAKDENKEAKDLFKQGQEARYSELNKMLNNGNLTQEIIDEEEKNRNISHEQSVKLSNGLTKQNEKNRKEQHKLDVEEDKELIYVNANNGVATDASELKTNDSSVLSLLKIQNEKVNNNNYNKELANITDYIWQHPEIVNNEEEKNNLVSRLIALNRNELPSGGLSRSPVDDIEKVVSRVTKAYAGKEKSFRDSLARKLGSPRFGRTFTPYENDKRASAFKELEDLIDSGKEISDDDINRIANTYMPNKEEYYRQAKNNDETYYSLVGQRDSLFIKSVEKGEDEFGGSTKREYISLSSKATFNDFDNYIQNLQNNHSLNSDGSAGALTEKQYQELYEPAAKYMSEIIRRSQKGNTIETYAMQKVIETYSGKGVPISNPTELYEIYRDVMNTLEEKGAERGGKVALLWGFTKTDIDNVVNEKMKMPKGNRYGK